MLDFITFPCKNQYLFVRRWIFFIKTLIFLIKSRVRCCKRKKNMINCLHYNINQTSKNVSFSHIFVNFINIVFSHKKQPGKSGPLLSFIPVRCRQLLRQMHRKAHLTEAADNMTLDLPHPEEHGTKLAEAYLQYHQVKKQS